MKLSKSLYKIVGILKRAYNDLFAMYKVFGWITPQEIIRQYGSSSSHWNIILKLIPSAEGISMGAAYQIGFSNNWIRWGLENDSPILFFEGQKEAFQERYQQIIQLIDESRSAEIIKFDIVDKDMQNIGHYSFAPDSEAFKQFAKRGIQGVINYFSVSSPLRRFR